MLGYTSRACDLPSLDPCADTRRARRGWAAVCSQRVQPTIAARIREGSRIQKSLQRSQRTHATAMQAALFLEERQLSPNPTGVSRRAHHARFAASLISLRKLQRVGLGVPIDSIRVPRLTSSMLHPDTDTTRSPTKNVMLKSSSSAKSSCCTALSHWPMYDRGGTQEEGVARRYGEHHANGVRGYAMPRALRLCLLEHRAVHHVLFYHAPFWFKTRL